MADVNEDETEAMVLRRGGVGLRSFAEVVGHNWRYTGEGKRLEAAEFKGRAMAVIAAMEGEERSSGFGENLRV